MIVTRTTATLNQRLKNDQPSIFGPLNGKELNSTSELRKAVKLLLVPALPNNSGNIALDTNACKIQISCALLQHQPDMTAQPVGYLSRSEIVNSC